MRCLSPYLSLGISNADCWFAAVISESDISVDVSPSRVIFRYLNFRTHLSVVSVLLLASNDSQGNGKLKTSSNVGISSLGSILFVCWRAAFPSGFLLCCVDSSLDVENPFTIFYCSKIQLTGHDMSLSKVPKMWKCDTRQKLSQKKTRIGIWWCEKRRRVVYQLTYNYK